MDTICLTYVNIASKKLLLITMYGFMSFVSSFSWVSRTILGFPLDVIIESPKLLIFSLESQWTSDCTHSRFARLQPVRVRY